MIPPVNHRRVLNGWDLFKSTLAFDMFFQPHNVELLKDVDYRFESDRLRRAAGAFKSRLVDTEQELIRAGVDMKKYIPLDEIATSIQY
jgi:hypothetical protein